ncbi:hypothetical protein [Ferrimicrobium acidiphilum]|nr:hypothetical protein [Ferrimicrobium acidiphilum]
MMERTHALSRSTPPLDTPSLIEVCIPSRGVRMFFDCTFRSFRTPNPEFSDSLRRGARGWPSGAAPNPYLTSSLVTVLGR